MAVCDIQIYAELLPNIRQISVSASLGSPLAADTTAEVRADGITFCVSHAGTVKELRLPGRVAPVAIARPLQLSAAVPRRIQGEKQRKQQLQQQEQDDRCPTASWRLPLSPAASASSAASAAEAGSAAAPWSAPDLAPKMAIACRTCRATLVEPGTILAWKDLPSDNWAEMMDFWHCHKPEHSHAQQQQQQHLAASRGYGADHAISAQSGVGFVDLTTLMFSESDCGSLLFSAVAKSGEKPVLVTSSNAASSSPLSPLARLNICCASCQTHIGSFNPQMSAVALFKWQLWCEATALPILSECLAAALLATTAQTGSSRFVVVPTTADSSEDLAHRLASSPVPQLWLLNNNIRYSSTSQAGPVAAMKLLYQLVSQAEADALLEKSEPNVQEIHLPGPAVDTIVEMLETSNAILPVKEKHFRDWQVGLLRRWEA